MKPLCILKTGTAIAGIPSEWGDFEHWIARAAQMDDQHWICCDVRAGETLPAIGDISGVIITGSPSMVTDREDWSERSADWLRELVQGATPALGICYGHQLMAHALGGEVDYHPQGREIGTKPLLSTQAAQQDLLFQVMPSSYLAHTTHSQSVVGLPPGAEVLAANDFEPHHGVRFAPMAWGVQFHPEFTADVMSRYLELRSGVLQKEGFDVARLLADVQDAAEGRALLPRFVDVVRATQA